MSYTCICIPCSREPPKWISVDCSFGMKYTMNVFWHSYWCHSEAVLKHHVTACGVCFPYCSKLPWNHKLLWNSCETGRELTISLPLSHRPPQSRIQVFHFTPSLTRLTKISLRLNLRHSTLTLILVARAGTKTTKHKLNDSKVFIIV